MKKTAFFRKNLNVLIVVAITVVLSVLAFTGGLSMSNQFLLEKIAIAVLLAVSLGMVVGFLGELSLGHAGFMCIGAYLGGKVASVLVPLLGGSDDNLLVVLISLLVGGISAALFGFIIGLPALRLRGDYLAIVTLAFGEIVRTLVMKMPESWFGGATGLTTPRFSSKYFFIIAFLMVILCLLFTQNLIRSKHGRAIISIRDNEIAARSMGIDVTKYKLLVFISSSFFAGVAGVLFSYSNNRMQYDVFDYNYSIEILVMVVLGGMGNINGSMIAAALITFLNTKLQTTLTGSMAVLQNLIYALILIVIVIYNNAPGLKGFRERHNLRVYLGRIFKKKQNTSVHAEDKEAN
jgi:branched-chain amino acid transport system permease protein